MAKFITEISEWYINWYCQEFLGKSKEVATMDELPFVRQTDSEHIHLVKVVDQIIEKVKSSGHEWTKEIATDSVSSFFEASLRYPVNPNYKVFFSLKYVNLNFPTIYRHIKSQLNGARQTGKVNTEDNSFNSAYPGFEKYI
jgi:hypothetical protein